MIGGTSRPTTWLMRQPAFSPTSLLKHRLEEHRGIEEALHDHIGLPGLHELHRLRGRSGRILRLVALEAGNIEPELAGDGIHGRDVAYEHGFRYGVLPCVYGRLEGGGVLRRRHGDAPSTGGLGCLDDTSHARDHRHSSS